MRRRGAFQNLVIDYDLEPKGYQVDIELLFQRKKKALQLKLEKQLKHHGGIKFQLSLNVLLGKYKLDINEYFEISPWFQSTVKQVLTFQSIKDKLDAAIRIILAFFDAFIQLGSGWFLKKILLLRLAIYRCNPFGGCEYIKLPPCLKSKHSLLSFNCYDNKCFLYSVLAAFRKQRNARRITSYTALISSLNLNGISFPTRLNEIPKFEKHNNVTINVFGMFQEEESNGCSRLIPFPMYISTNFENEHKKHINLLLYKNHYMLIKNIDKFIRPFFWKKTRYFCCKCLLSFNRKISYKLHKQSDCLNNNYTGQAYALPLKGTRVKFAKYSHQIKNPFIIYADFETFNEEINKSKGKGGTLLKSKHNLNAFGAISISKYTEYSKPPYIYIGQNVIAKFVQYIYQVRAEISYILDYKRLPLQLTVEDIQHLSKQTKCYLCGIALNTPGLKKVVDHAHLGREGKGRDVNYACNTCNLLHSSLKFTNLKIPIVMHNAMNYDSHFIIQEIHRFIKSRISVLPRSSEKFLTLSFDNFCVVDSFQFLPNSLANLADLLANKDKADMKETLKYLSKTDLLPFVIRKGVMCYDYINSWERLNEKRLPSKDHFFNKLTNKHILTEEYNHAQFMFKAFSCNTIKDYLKQYLKVDVLLLCDVFESFRERSLVFYGLDPAKYLTAPALSYDAMLRHTNIKFDLLDELDMYNFIENGIRGGITNVIHRFAETRNENEHIVYLDCNNLYGYAMTQLLPYKDFKWLDPNTYSAFNVQDIKDDNPVGYILEVTLEYPNDLHDLHDMYPLAPEKLSIDYSQLSPYALFVLNKYDMKYKKGATKLISTLSTKKKYTVHYRNLKLYLDLGMKIKEIHKILSFKQSQWMKPYIDFNNLKRKEATSTFDKEFFKLMNNSVFGKCMENVKRRMKMELTSNADRCKVLIQKPTFHSLHIFQSDFVGVQYKKPQVLLNKPVYLGFTILELSKMHMYDFHYNYMLKSFGLESLKLLYTDTDSFIYKIWHENYQNIMKELLDLFDFSNLDSTHPLCNNNNHKVMGKFKDEAAGKKIKEFIALRPKMYSILFDSGEVMKRVKGVHRTSVNSMFHSEFKDVLLNSKQTYALYNTIRSFKHQVYTVEEHKLALSPFEDKRWLYPNGVRSLAYGNCKIRSRKRKINAENT